MRMFITIVAFIGMAIFSYIAWIAHSWVSAAALVGSIVTFFTALANIKSSNNPDKNNINQSISKNSKGIQVGGNLIIGAQEKDKK